MGVGSRQYEPKGPGQRPTATCQVRTAYILHPTPCSLLPAPCSLLPAACSLLPASCSLLPAPHLHGSTSSAASYFLLPPYFLCPTATCRPRRLTSRSDWPTASQHGTCMHACTHACRREVRARQVHACVYVCMCVCMHVGGKLEPASTVQTRPVLALQPGSLQLRPRSVDTGAPVASRK